jgi:hypothetical protein
VKQGVRAAKQKAPAISFGLGAEQGRTWTVFADKWEQLAKKIRLQLKEVTPSVYVGPHFDPLKLCG